MTLFKNGGSKLLLLSCFLFALSTLVGSAKILCMYPSPGRSHLIVAKALFKGLAEHGHEVTVVSSFPLEKPMKNYRDVVIPISFKFQEFMTKDMMDNAGNKMQMLKSAPRMMDMTLDLSNKSLHYSEFQKIMKEESFDLMILGYFMNNFLIGLGAHFNCPIIMMSPAGVFGDLNDLVGNPEEIAYVPHVFNGIAGQMNYGERLKNLIIGIIQNMLTVFMNCKYEIYYNANFPQPKYPSFEKMKKNISLIFINSHFSQGVVRPFVPAMVEIGGIHIKDQPDQLPDDLQQFLDSAKDGAIYFSMGSNLQSADLDEQKLSIIVNTFKKLKQKVLWKFEDDTLKGLPKNVKISKWLPQDSVLAHPNTKLFITHAGKGSIVESKFYGVPVVMMPFFGDQPGNAELVEAEGWGVRIFYNELTESILINAIIEVLDNPKYAKIVGSFSKLYRDRPNTAMETAVYWVEYVIRHRGAKHLQSNSVHLNFFQLHSFDTLGLLVLILYVILKINLIICGWFCGLCFGKKNKKSRKNKSE